jgi:hypothetical protein
MFISSLLSMPLALLILEVIHITAKASKKPKKSVAGIIGLGKANIPLKFGKYGYAGCVCA